MNERVKRGDIIEIRIRHGNLADEIFKAVVISAEDTENGQYVCYDPNYIRGQDYICGHGCITLPIAVRRYGVQSWEIIGVYDIDKPAPNPPCLKGNPGYDLMM